MEGGLHCPGSVGGNRGACRGGKAPNGDKLTAGGRGRGAGGEDTVHSF